MPWRERWASGQCDSQGPDAAPPGSWLSTEESLAQSSLADTSRRCPKAHHRPPLQVGLLFLHSGAISTETPGQDNSHSLLDHQRSPTLCHELTRQRLV